MKKLLIVLLSFLLILGTYLIEGGSITTLLCFSSFFPIVLGTLITSLFSFSWTEITQAFKDAAGDNWEASRFDRYSRGLQVIRYMSTALMFWAVTIIILAIMGIMSSLTSLDQLGPRIAVAFTALLYSFGLRSVLLNPMEANLNKKCSLGLK